MNILITGANGFIGKYLTENLTSDGHTVFPITRKEVDLSCKTSVDLFFQNFNQPIDLIIHTAFILCGPNESTETQLENFKKNVAITEHIIKIAQKITPKKIINLSSMAVYPNKNGTYSEDSEIKPSDNTDSIYGLAKFCSENLFDFFLKQIPTIHLRIAQVYGEKMRCDRIIPVFKEELQQDNKITVFGDGERVSCFIEVNKLISIIKKFIETNEQGIFNIGDEHISYYDLAKKIINAYGNENSKIVKKTSGSKSKFYLNLDKMNHIIQSVSTTH